MEKKKEDLLIQKLPYLKNTEESEQILYENINYFGEIIRIRRFRHEIDDDYSHVPKHWHRSIEFIIPLTGQVTYWEEGEFRTIKSGDFELVNSRYIHSTRILHQDLPYFGYAVQVNHEFTKNIKGFDGYIFSPQKGTSSWKEIVRLLHELIADYEAQSQFVYLDYLGIVYRILFLLMTQTKKKPIDMYKTEKFVGHLTEIVNYIDENAFSQINVESVAQHFNYSPGHLSRLFKEQLHTTVMSYVYRIRVMKAYEMLISSQASITEIAYQTGFPNMNSFSREFRKAYGSSPKDYRKSLKI